MSTDRPVSRARPASPEGPRPAPPALWPSPPDRPVGSRLLGYVQMAAAAVIWGSVGLVVRSAGLPGPVTAFYRVFFAALALGTALALVRRDLLHPRGQIQLLALLGLLLAGDWASFFLAIQHTSVASAVLAASTAPVLVAVFAPFLLGEPTRRTTWLALGLAFAGLAVLIGGAGPGGRAQLGGVAFGLGTAVFYALRTVLSRRAGRHLPALTTAFYSAAAASVFLAPALVLLPHRVRLDTWPWLVALGVVHTALAVSLMISALRRISAQAASALSYLEPVSAAVLAALFLGEPLTTGVLAGGGLILAAGALAVAGEEHGRRTQPAAAQPVLRE
jgi:drug/metabolite transporter (DMT)-like permease